ncbi:flagellar motor protein MotB [Sphingomonas gilva]|uniref:flagellar motor protein MotB n=1 Tax=Sphingomonas gilva TaxID=2305907 RepID=UPI0015FBEC1F|nr:flagellar motor protein MotB [Sphingomonas gilva]
MIGAGQRWAISLADLLMLLLGFFVLLDASKTARGAQMASVSAAVTGVPVKALRTDAATLFADGEAMLTSTGLARIRAIKGDALVRVAVNQQTQGRYDRWDLAAARAAAIARALPGKAEVELSSSAPANEVLIVRPPLNSG